MGLHNNKSWQNSLYNTTYGEWNPDREYWCGLFLLPGHGFVFLPLLWLVLSSEEETGVLKIKFQNFQPSPFLSCDSQLLGGKLFHFSLFFNLKITSSSFFLHPLSLLLLFFESNFWSVVNLKLHFISSKKIFQLIW